MIRLKEILLKEGRSEALDKEEFIELYNTKASGYDFMDGKIYRGLDYSADFAMVDPRKYGERESAYAEGNYYTMIINHSQEWKKYPKRELICSSSSTHASNYGPVYLVVPFNGIDWGICPTRDIFYSFPRLFEVMPKTYDYMGKFNQFLDSTILERDVNSFEELKAELQRVGDQVEEYVEKKKYKLGTFPEFWESYKNSMFYEYNELDQFILDLLDPEENGFEYQSQWSGAPDNREVWTDGPCLLIRYEKYKEISLEL